jgi:hypothetical protein
MLGKLPAAARIFYQSMLNTGLGIIIPYACKRQSNL